MHIAVSRNEVVVPGEDHRLLKSQQRPGMLLKALHPGQLVIVFRAGRRIAIGQIDRGDADRAAVRADHGLDIARLIILIIAGQGALADLFDGAF